MHKTAFNTTDQPVAIDEEGRRIGGREWGTINTTDPVAKQALEDGLIVITERPAGNDEINPQAAEAFAVTEAAAELAELPADEVKQLVDDDDATKAEAVEKAARSGGTSKARGDR
jgi:hypothetical protein